MQLREKGFTLIEMIMTIVIIGIVASTMMFFLQKSMAGFFDARARLEASNNSYSTLIRVKRELRSALPNSLRLTVSGGVYYLEFVPVLAAGRYRAGGSSSGDAAPGCPADSSVPDNGVLTVGLLDSCFKTIGSADFSKVSAGNWVVLFNAGVGVSGADFYESGAVTGGNKALVTGVIAGGTEAKVSFEPLAFPWGSPSNRFFATGGPVTIACDPLGKSLVRYSGYAPQSSQPTGGLAVLPGAVKSKILDSIKACSIAYSPTQIGNQFGLVSVSGTVDDGSGGGLVLAIQTQVSNVP